MKTSTIQIVKNISNYLTFGFHHSTPQAQNEMKKLIDEGLKKKECVHCFGLKITLKGELKKCPHCLAAQLNSKD